MKSLTRLLLTTGLMFLATGFLAVVALLAFTAPSLDQLQALAVLVFDHYTQ